ncbi:MAG: class B sortase [Eubacteriales bacterium]|nr:class B sortase [Eubacteriales bacterium]
MKKGLKVLLVIVLILCIGAFVFSGLKLLKIQKEYKEAREYYDQLSDTYVSVAATPAPDENADKVEVTETEDKEVCPITVDFNNLLATNKDVCAWLYSGDTPINYVVVQGEDNNNYLHHKLDGTYNASGTLFIDCECGPNFSGANTIIYGHNMKDGSMFASLHNYVDQSYYDAHPVLYISTPACDYKLEVFSCFTCDYDADTYTLSFASEEDYSAFLTKMASQSNVKTNVEVSSEERVVTLSTCTYEYDNARYVVMAKLVPLAQ